MKDFPTKDEINSALDEFESKLGVMMLITNNGITLENANWKVRMDDVLSEYDTDRPITILEK